MSLQEAAIAIGLLTPLILGILAFIEKIVHQKKDPVNEPKVVQGMTVPMDTYADRLIANLTKESEEDKANAQKLEHENQELLNELKLYRERSKE